MSTKSNRNCQKAVKRTIGHCLRGQKVGGAPRLILLCKQLSGGVKGQACQWRGQACQARAHTSKRWSIQISSCSR